MTSHRIVWRLPRVLHHTGLSRSTIYAMIERGDFPQQVKLGPRAVGWVAQDVRDWIDAKIENRPAERLGSRYPSGQPGTRS